ncbi:hypothetical protein [Halorubrum vacuolatum]|uniref:Uncharacterized protein n=1 Tax=Halorubrum vacuolatum TaxID=63740 RepID=A0A238WTM4_HALVU|nr:hypothetical protein [Halorubrum vacuolatum]SNR49897.1 hypothetical protein SAMN06264855_11031 [Halorubrum vacuolatum]
MSKKGNTTKAEVEKAEYYDYLQDNAPEPEPPEEYGMEEREQEPRW